METISVNARHVEEGDQIPSLDNAYVFEAPTLAAESQISIRTYPDHPYVVPESFVLINFHDSNGDEGYLIVPGDMTITVQREG